MNLKDESMRYAVFALLGVFLMACSTDVTISMDAGNPPTFKFARNFSEVNTLPFFDVVEVARENENLPYHEQHFEKNVTLWRIVPEKVDTPIDQLPSITYGHVPTGFSQKLPESGSPPALVEGRVYEAGGPPVMMRRAIIRFAIRNGRAVRIPISE
jgi:hypothetical protein